MMWRVTVLVFSSILCVNCHYNDDDGYTFTPFSTEDSPHPKIVIGRNGDLGPFIPDSYFEHDVNDYETDMIGQEDFVDEMFGPDFGDVQYFDSFNTIEDVDEVANDIIDDNGIYKGIVGLKVGSGERATWSEDDNSVGLGNESLTPPSAEDINNALGDCNCKQILVSSLGEAQHVQSNSMGIYKYWKLFNGKPYYYNTKGNSLYFLNGSGWLIGAKLGATSGFIHNGAQYACPYLIPDGWMYVNHGYWYRDASLVVRCTS